MLYNDVDLLKNSFVDFYNYTPKLNLNAMQAWYHQWANSAEVNTYRLCLAKPAHEHGKAMVTGSLATTWRVSSERF